MVRLTFAIRCWASLLAVMAIGFVDARSTQAVAIAMVIAGSPAYDSTTSNGFQNGGLFIPGYAVNISGTAVGFAEKLVSGNPKGDRAVRWNSTGVAAVELGNLGLNGVQFTHTSAFAINDAGTAAGYSDKYDSGNFVGTRAVRWDGAGTAATELDNLGTDVNGVTNGQAFAINTAGTTVGYSDKYDLGDFTFLGSRAVRWDAAGTVATELGDLGTDAGGFTDAGAVAVNDAGTAVGSAVKYFANSSRGRRAVRWDSSGTTATELGNLGTDSAGPTGSTHAIAYAVNDAGTAVGYAHKYVGTSFVGARAVRWDFSGTAATELGNLGTDVTGAAAAVAYAVNTAGTAVGYSAKYLATVYKGNRAVRWNSTGTAATELANLGTDASGVTNAEAYAVNDAGTAVGYASKYFDFGGGNFVPFPRAVIWLPDNSAIDLNDISNAAIPNDGFWQLRSASSISDDGWVAGSGLYFPNVGSSYTRNWVAQVGIGGTWTNALTGTLNGTWGRGRQWSTGTPAMLAGNATFSAASTYTVSLDRNEATHSVTVSGGNMTLNLNTYTLTSELPLTITSGATLNVNASGVPTIVGAVSNAGTLSFGAGVGTLHATGSYSQSASGKLQIDLASASSFDKLLVDGSASLGGTLEVFLLGGYSPALGAQFDILDPASTTGTFTSYLLPALDPSLQWNTANLATTGVLSVTIAGNFNGDSAVNSADYVTWRKGVGTTYTANDYFRWRENFGLPAPSSSPGSSGLSLSLAAAAVPEPASIAILTSAFAVLCTRRRSRV